MKIIASFTGLLIRGLKYSVFGGVLSVAASRGSSALERHRDERRERGGGEREKDAVISPIDHPTRGPTPFLDPLRATRSLADHI